MVELEQMRSADVVRAVADGRLDFGIVREDAVPKEVKRWRLGEVGARRLGGVEVALVDLTREAFDVLQHGRDLSADLGGGRQIGLPQPVMAHHPLLIGVGDAAPLQGLHCIEGLRKSRLQLIQQVRVEPHTADVQVKTQAGVMVKPILITIPEVMHRSGGVEVEEMWMNRRLRIYVRLACV